MRQIRLIIAAFFVIAPYAANAGLIINVVENAGDVVASYSGTLDLSVTLGIQNNNADSTFDGYLASGGNIAFIALAPVVTYFIDVGTWTPFGSGGFGVWDASSGDALALFSNPLLGLPTGYVSGSVISGTGTKFGSSFAVLGFAPGSYLTTLTNGNITDFVLVNIGPVASVPEPGTLALLGIGLAGMGLVRRRKTV